MAQTRRGGRRGPRPMPEAALERRPAPKEAEPVADETTQPDPEEPEQSGPAFQTRDITPRGQEEPDPARLLADMRRTERATAAKLALEPHVPVRLPKVLNRGAGKKLPESAVPVRINGALYAVPRGKTVLVPTSVYKILENAGYLDGSEAELNVPPPVRLQWPGRAV